MMMKTVKNLTLVAIAIVAMAFTNRLNDGNHQINSQESKVQWIGKKVTGQHIGIVNIKHGELVVKNGQLEGGTFTIDMTSITSTDLEGEYLQKLNGHL